MGTLISSELRCIVTPTWTFQSLVRDYMGLGAPWKKAKGPASSYPRGTPAFAVAATHRTGVHWVALGVMPKQKQLVYYDSMSPEQEAAPPKMHMQRWLQLLESQHPCVGIVAEEAKSWQWWPHVGLPKQLDCSSCGIFALCFVQCMASGKHDSRQHTYSHALMPQLRQELARAVEAGKELMRI